jgi:hypothetical protein
VKSAYHLAVQRKREVKGAIESSNSCQEHKGRLALWSTSVPGKVKVHVWRLIENGLAVGTELKHRNIKDGVICLACGRSEDLVHRFWTCPHSAMAWSLVSECDGTSVELPPKNLRCHSELKGWLLEVIGRNTTEQNSWLFMLLYNLWLARNDARESRNMEDPTALVRRTAVAIEE